jgi:large subunit ribosomal protein L7Ae
MTKENAKAKMPKEITDKALQIVEIARNSGKLRRGTNESTKAIEKGNVQLQVIAEDVEPKEIVMHLPALCDEKKIPYVHVSSKIELGRASGIDVPCAAIAVVDVGDAKEQLKEILKSMEKISKE